MSLEKIQLNGLQTSKDTVDFWRSEEGKKCLTELISFIIKKEQEIEASVVAIQQAELKAQSMRISANEEDVKREDKRHQAYAAAAPILDRIPKQPDPPERNDDNPIRYLHKDLTTTITKFDVIEKKYKTFNDSTTAADDFIAKLNINDRTNCIPQLEAEIARIEGTEAEQIQARGEVDSLVASNRDDEALNLQNFINAKSAQSAILKDMLAVVKQEKIMFDKNGKEVTSFAAADFIVPKDKKIAKEEGSDQLYLINADQDISQLTPDQKLQGKKDFERSRPDIANIKNLINENQRAEMGDLVTKVRGIISQLQQLERPNPAYDAPFTAPGCTVTPQFAPASLTQPNAVFLVPASSVVGVAEPGNDLFNRP